MAPSSNGLSPFEGLGVTLRFAAISLACAVASIFTRRVFLVRNLFLYSSLNLMVISVLVYTKRGPWIIGKDRETGQLPLWSLLLYWPFHLTNRIVAYLAKRYKGVDPATEVYHNFYIGGWYADELGISWNAVVDLTCELPERCSAEKYLNLQQWDGVVQLEDVKTAAEFLVENAKSGPVLCHCAHGVGRSTTVMRAALVEAGVFKDVDEAFLHLKEARPACRTNKHFQNVLYQWQKSR